MTSSEFYSILDMDDIQLSIPKTSHFTIGTSPYYAHQHGLAIDIYQDLFLDNYEVLSPISGKVLTIKTLTAPKPKFPDGIAIDYLVLISNPNSSEVLWKIMHVKPALKIGEKIEVGDLLGKTIRNGYFAYWSSPHMHLEIRSIDDAIRARGGINFSLALNENNLYKEANEIVNTLHIPIKINSIFPEMILATLPQHFYTKISPIYGVLARIGNFNGILDGGIPHYKIGTVISQLPFSSDSSQSIFWGINKIGVLHEAKGHFGFFKFDKVKLLLNDIEIRGISLYLANFLPLVKIIPYEMNQFSFEQKTTQYLSIKNL